MSKTLNPSSKFVIMMAARGFVAIQRAVRSDQEASNAFDHLVAKKDMARVAFSRDDKGGLLVTLDSENGPVIDGSKELDKVLILDRGETDVVVVVMTQNKLFKGFNAEDVNQFAATAMCTVDEKLDDSVHFGYVDSSYGKEIYALVSVDGESFSKFKVAEQIQDFTPLDTEDQRGDLIMLAYKGDGKNIFFNAPKSTVTEFMRGKKSLEQLLEDATGAIEREEGDLLARIMIGGKRVPAIVRDGELQIYNLEGELQSTMNLGLEPGSRGTVAFFYDNHGKPTARVLTYDKLGGADNYATKSLVDFDKSPAAQAK